MDIYINDLLKEIEEKKEEEKPKHRNTIEKKRKKKKDIKPKIKYLN